VYKANKEFREFREKLGQLDLRVFKEMKVRSVLKVSRDCKEKPVRSVHRVSRAFKENKEYKVGLDLRVTLVQSVCKVK
jgi:hypothetical protein